MDTPSEGRLLVANASGVCVVRDFAAKDVYPHSHPARTLSHERFAIGQ